MGPMVNGTMPTIPMNYPTSENRSCCF